MPLAYLHMIAMPCNGALDDLTVNTCVFPELVAIRPLLKIEEVAEELEGFGLAQQPQAKRTAEMTFEERRRFFPGPRASGKYRQRSPRASARRLLLSTAQA